MPLIDIFGFVISCLLALISVVEVVRLSAEMITVMEKRSLWWFIGTVIKIIFFMLVCGISTFTALTALA